MSAVSTSEMTSDQRQSCVDSESLDFRRELQRLRAENEFLRQKEQTFHRVFESASDAIVTLDQHGHILYVNAGVQHVFGHSPEQLTGQSLERLIPGDVQSSLATDLRRFVRTGLRQSAWSGMRTRGRHRDGHEFPIEVSFGAMRLPDGSYRFTGIIRDVTQHVEKEITERQQLSELAHQQRLRAVNEMATGLAHELNQPLQAICLQADAAAQLCPECLPQTDSDAPPTSDDTSGLSAVSTELRDALTEIADQAERASRIIRAVRELVRRNEPRRETVSLSSLVEAVLPICELSAERAGIELAVRVPPNLPQVRVDSVQIEQVLVNLIQNAVEAMERTVSGPRLIELSATPGSPASTFAESVEERCVTVAVRDYGTGLPDGIRQQVFENFFTTRPDGVGLGLAICRTIVEDHGGRISAADAEPGAEFTFTIPTAPPLEDVR
ncbi:MAG: two-component system sensor histidine kinase NtrB [Planctomycetota bacterium]